MIWFKSRTFKSATISHTFECATNSCTIDIQAQYNTYVLLSYIITKMLKKVWNFSFAVNF